MFSLHTFGWLSQSARITVLHFTAFPVDGAISIIYLYPLLNFTSSLFTKNDKRKGKLNSSLQVSLTDDKGMTHVLLKCARTEDSDIEMHPYFT